jgi:hypothetical protein
MVVQGYFGVELVRADTKQPFQEHVKDWEVYVEVEPDAEYFISVRRIGNPNFKDLLVTFFVDGKDLGYYSPYTRGVMEKGPEMKGLYSRANGVHSMRALKFKKPRSTGSTSESSFHLLLGKVEAKVYEAIFDGEVPPDKWTSASLAAASVNLNQCDLDKKKGLRTGEGSTVENWGATPKMINKCYKKGALIDTVTLHYGSLPGLIQVGVLSAPPVGSLN